MESGTNGDNVLPLIGCIPQKNDANSVEKEIIEDTVIRTKKTVIISPRYQRKALIYEVIRNGKMYIVFEQELLPSEVHDNLLILKYMVDELKEKYPKVRFPGYYESVTVVEIDNIKSRATGTMNYSTFTAPRISGIKKFIDKQSLISFIDYAGHERDGDRIIYYIDPEGTNGEIFVKFIKVERKEKVAVKMTTINNEIKKGIKMDNKEKDVKIEENVDKKTLDILKIINNIDKNGLEKLFLDAMRVARENDTKKLTVDKEICEKAKLICIKEYAKMMHERIRQGDYMYRASDIVYFISSVMSQPWTDLRGVNGIGKDTLIKLFAILSCEDYEEQVLEITASVGLEFDDKRILGYQHALTDKYQLSKYLLHVKKANKNQGKPYFVFISEANIVNIDKSFVSIAASTDSAFKKITLPRSGVEGSEFKNSDPEVTNNIFTFLTTNDYKERKELSLMNIDRMSIVNFVNPILRKTKDRSGESYRPIVSSDPMFVELFRIRILEDKLRKMSVRDAYYSGDDYSKFEDKYNDNLVTVIEDLNIILKNGHMSYAQMAPRFQDAALKFLYYAIMKFGIDEKLAMDQLMLQKFIPRIENTTDEYVDVLKQVKDLLVKNTESEKPLLGKDCETIKEIDNIIWKGDPYGQDKDDPN